MTTMTARDVASALYHHFGGRWAMLTEVTARPDRPWRYQPGMTLSEVNAERDSTRPRRIDVLLLRAGKVDGGIERLAIEIKVSRADFLADVRNPNKQAPWRAIAHRHAYAVPAGLVSVDEVPAESGLITVGPKPEGYWAPVEFARRAPRVAGHEPGPLPLANIMDAFWRTARAEALTKGLTRGTRDGIGVDGDLEQLRARVTHLEREVELAHGREERMREQRDDWRKRYAVHEPPACGSCGQALHVARGRPPCPLRRRRLGAPRRVPRRDLRGAAQGRRADGVGRAARRGEAVAAR